MNFIALSKDSPDIAKAIEGCEVGVTKTLTVTVTPVSDSDTLLVATVDSVEYTEEEEVKDAVQESAPDTTPPYKPRAKAGSATAVETY